MGQQAFSDKNIKKDNLFVPFVTDNNSHNPIQDNTNQEAGENEEECFGDAFNFSSSGDEDSGIEDNDLAEISGKNTEGLNPEAQEVQND